MKRARSYAPTQKTFEFDRAVRLWMLERVQPLCPCRATGKHYCACAARVGSLLKALDGFALNDSKCKISICRIAESMKQSRATVKRAIRIAIDLGYLKVTSGGDDDPARKSGERSTYAINWGRVWRETMEKAPSRILRKVPEDLWPQAEADRVSDGGTMSHPPLKNEPPPTTTMSHLPPKNEPPAPPPSCTSIKRPPPSRAEPDPVVVAVVEAGVALAAEAVTAARSHGMTDAAILQHVMHFANHPGRWGPGALAKRLESPSTPHLAPDQGWPPDSPGWRPPVQTGRNLEAIIDAMSIDEIRAAIPEHEQLIQKLRLSHDHNAIQSHPVIRNALRHKLSGRAEGQLAAV